jgi:alkanesulfonate monooxygenase SsuD/methylene tetrahydromethanopterin reductase-like flavin-dependent oxidoreductase (luciferase family)
VRAMLAGEKVAFAGKTLRTRGFRLLAPPPAPVPIYIGALRPPMLKLAGEVGDGVIVNLFPAHALPSMLAHVGAAARAAGKDPETFECVCRHQVLVTSDKEKARETFRAGLTGYFATPVYNKFLAWYGFEEEAALIATGFRTRDRSLTRRGMTDRVVDGLGIFGSAEECRSRVAEYAAAGVTTAVISPLALDPEAISRTIEAFAG